MIDAEPDDEGVRPLVGCGENLPDQKIVIVDPETLAACPPGRIGEIWVQGPSVAQGYWQQPEATERTFRARLKDTGEGPFLRTGDLGFLQDGELFVTGRLKDLIIVHGVNYYPQDIERTVQQSHPRLRPDCGGGVHRGERRPRATGVVQEIERHKQSDFSGVFDGHPPRRGRRARIGPRRDRADQGGQRSQDLQRQDPAARLPRRLSGGHAGRGGAMAGRRRPGRKPRGRRREACRRGAAGGRRASAAGVRRLEERQERPAPRRSNDRLTQLVVEEIRRVAKERADGMTLDSPIVETGMDSLERMEILASLEEKFGGRFPEEVLPDLETTRQLVAAVEKYLGTRAAPGRASGRPTPRFPPAAYRFDQFPEYVKLRENLDMLEASGLGNPFFVVHDGPTTDRTIIAGRELINFSSYNYLGMSGDPAVSAAAKAAIDRYGTSASASRLVSGQKAHSRRVGAGDDPLPGHGRHDRLGRRPRHERNGDRPPDGPRRPDPPRRAWPTTASCRGAILSGARRRPFPHNDWQAADQLLEQFRHEYRRVLIVIEGVYSMDGDIPDLPALRRGQEAAQGAADDRRGPLDGRAGGHGPRHRRTLRRRSRRRGHLDGNVQQVASAVAAAISPAARRWSSICVTRRRGSCLPRPCRRRRRPRRWPRCGCSRPSRSAWRGCARTPGCSCALARQHGLNTGTSKDSPVVPVILGNSIHCLKLSKAMFARGVNVQPILHPAVEESASRLRYFITARHTEQQIRYTIEAMVEELEKIDPSHLARAPSAAPRWLVKTDYEVSLCLPNRKFPARGEALFRGAGDGDEVFAKAEQLLDELRPESPLRHRLGAELEELRQRAKQEA